jgi:hypothetical protein
MSKISTDEMNEMIKEITESLTPESAERIVQVFPDELLSFFEEIVLLREVAKVLVESNNAVDGKYEIDAGCTCMWCRILPNLKEWKEL